MDRIRHRADPNAAVHFTVQPQTERFVAHVLIQSRGAIRFGTYRAGGRHLRLQQA